MCDEARNEEYARPDNDADNNTDGIKKTKLSLERWLRVIHGLITKAKAKKSTRSHYSYLNFKSPPLKGDLGGCIEPDHM